MKNIIICITAISLMTACVDKKKTNDQLDIVTKTNVAATVTTLTFEQELVSKSNLPDTLAMASYRTSGRFVGLDQLKDSIIVQIDVEAQKVTGTLTQYSKGKAIDSVFEGILKDNTIIATRGLNNKSILSIDANNLILRRGAKTFVLKLK